MKKVVSLLLAVVLVFSMATVALASGDQPNKCPACGATFEKIEEYSAHLRGGCNVHFRPCPLGCGEGFDSDEQVEAHTKECWNGSAHCDYCGEDFSPIYKYDEHIDACKAKYFNIPLAKIIATIKDLISKIDFNAVINTVKDVAGKVVPVVKDLFGKIDLGAIKLPA